MQINPRAINRLVRLGAKAFRAFQSSQKQGQTRPADQHRTEGHPAEGHGGPRRPTTGSGTNGGGAGGG
ncbi:hypothetical protein JTF08_07265 [Micrococcaceae bacterium RIT802]|nr:hypothetical protein [Micrococcaceae bacterium RIT 802]